MNFHIGDNNGHWYIFRPNNTMWHLMWLTTLRWHNDVTLFVKTFKISDLKIKRKWFSLRKKGKMQSRSHKQIGLCSRRFMAASMCTTIVTMRNCGQSWSRLDPRSNHRRPIQTSDLRSVIVAMVVHTEAAVHLQEQSPSCARGLLSFFLYILMTIIFYWFQNRYVYFFNNKVSHREPPQRH